MDNRKLLEGITKDMKRMDGIRRSQDSDNRTLWLTGLILIEHAMDDRYQAVVSANKADQIIAGLMRSSR